MYTRSFGHLHDWRSRVQWSCGTAALLAVLCLGVASTGAQSAITIAVDAAANRRPINPNIYGVAHATAAELNDLNSPLNRNGGNNTTRYNWQVNADNRGSDWYFQSIAEPSATPGERGDTFIAGARAANAQAMLTIPLIDWVGLLHDDGADHSRMERAVIRQRSSIHEREAEFPACRNAARIEYARRVRRRRVRNRVVVRPGDGRAAGDSQRVRRVGVRAERTRAYRDRHGGGRTDRPCQGRSR